MKEIDPTSLSLMQLLELMDMVVTVHVALAEDQSWDIRDLKPKIAKHSHGSYGH